MKSNPPTANVDAAPPPGVAEFPVRHASRWRAVAWLATTAVALTALCGWSYRNCLHTFFHFDDFWVLAAADRIQLRSPLDIVQFFRPVQGFLLYRPVSTVLYFYLQHLLFGYDPSAFHATQIAFHILAAVLVYAIADTLFLSRPLGLATALVYVTAPGHAIAACWIALFTITGTALFYFLGLWAWLRLDSPWRGSVCSVLFGIALLASEHAVSFPLVLTLSDILLERPNWRRIVRQQALFYTIAAAYVIGKLYYVHVLIAPTLRAYVQRGYALSLDPRLLLEHLGRYVGFSIDVAYRSSVSDAWALAGGGGVALIAALATGCVLSGKWSSRSLRVATFGVDLFIVALGPVLVLKAHLYSYYVGIAALGSALALIGFARSLPRATRLAPLSVVALLLAVHVLSTSARVRQSQEFRFLSGFERGAALWLYTLALLPDQNAIDEVVIPRDGVTEVVFDQNHAEKGLLCAHFTVRTSPRVEAEELVPGRVILHQAVSWGNVPATFRSWDWLRKACADRALEPMASPAVDSGRGLAHYPPRGRRLTAQCAPPGLAPRPAVAGTATAHEFHGVAPQLCALCGV